MTLRQSIAVIGRQQLAAMQDHFSRLPVELAVEILAYLYFSDLLPLRRVSRFWNNLIVRNEGVIARRCLENTNLPSFVTRLFPPPPTAELRLNYLYIVGVKHRFIVCSKVAEHMCGTLSESSLLNIFPYRGDLRVQAGRLKSRLVTVLFYIYHYFENYKRALWDCAVSSRADNAGAATGKVTVGNGAEVPINNFDIQFQILSSYEGYMPALVESVVQILTSLFAFIPEHVQAATFCLNGLPRLLQMAEDNPRGWSRYIFWSGYIHERIPDRQAWRVAEEKWYAGLTSDSAPGAGETEEKEKSPKTEEVLESASSGGPPEHFEEEHITPDEMKWILRGMPQRRIDICSTAAVRCVQDTRGIRYRPGFVGEVDFFDILPETPYDNVFEDCRW
ncbi:hypothetical protein V8F20_006363 [Naviculisporaceae sp. PSN 640]